MCSASRILLVFVAACASHPGEPLRVCADPNNLPFSNEAGEGFENELAQLIARDLDRPVEYTWLPQRRGFVRNTLGAGACDVIAGVPAGFERTATTHPYYRSSYAFVTRADGPAVRSFDDPALRNLTIGLHAIGDDYANVPPALALAKQGLSDHIVGYTIYGDYSQPNPPAALIDAVARGDIDVAVAWGPLAGYFAERADVPLRVDPIASDEPGTSFAIAMGVRRDDAALRDTLDAELERRADDIDALLDRYDVPHQEVPR